MRLTTSAPPSLSLSRLPPDRLPKRSPIRLTTSAPPGLWELGLFIFDNAAPGVAAPMERLAADARRGWANLAPPDAVPEPAATTRVEEGSGARYEPPKS